MLQGFKSVCLMFPAPVMIGEVISQGLAHYHICNPSVYNKKYLMVNLCLFIRLVAEQ